MTKINKPKVANTKANSLLAEVINILKGEDSKGGNVHICLMDKMKSKQGIIINN